MIFSDLVTVKPLNSNHRMLNMYANFLRIFEVRK